jgi:DNA-binding CsgD family transcriptional regulator
VPAHTVVDSLSYREVTDLIATVLSKEDLRLLLEIADGDRYADIARDHNMSVSCLKSKAYRIREKLRKSRVSAALQCGLH